MAEWLDRFTGRVYQLKGEQVIRQQLASELAGCVVSDPHTSANAVARYWFTSYYERLFPLRFGREPIGEQNFYKQGAPLVYEQGGEFPENAKWRTAFLEDKHHPPILPAETQPALDKPALLIADHHLATAALLNVCLRRQGVNEQVVHEARLGALLHELSDLTELQNALHQFPIALALAQYLKAGGGKLPDALQPYQVLIDAIHKGDARNAPDVEFCIVGLAAQRIKQYVFETPGLPEIRGASQLLDEVVAEMAETVAKEIGQECILQTAASTLNFLAPEPSEWTTCLKRAFYEKTLVAFCASAAHTVSLPQFLGHYSQCMRDFLTAMDADRYRAELPVWECLPFEARCVFCKRRAAVELIIIPDEEPEPVCEACHRKRHRGDADERFKLGVKPLQDAGMLSQIENDEDFKRLGGEFDAKFGSIFNPEPNEEFRKLRRIKPWERSFRGGLNLLVPDTDEREGKKQIAFIYGDGSNFGQITKNLDSLAMSLQWTRRAELVNRAAIALALSRAMHEAVDKGARLQRMPYEVLVVGGDDFSLFTWSRLALRFCQQFLELTDLEYAKGNPDDCIVGATPICYGVGCLMSDEKAPAQRVVEFTEANLLKFAKRGVKAHQRGALAFLFTTNADQIPSDYKDHLQRNYRKEARLGKGQSAQVPVYLTMQPLTACELNAFLECAREIMSKQLFGNLQRLTEPFVRQPIEAAFLHFVYQRARAFGKDENNEQRDSEQAQLFRCLDKMDAVGRRYSRERLFPVQPLARLVPVKEGDLPDQPAPAYFAPILDLLEIVKSLR